MIVYQPFIGRPFLYGVRDCYALVRDIYEASFGLKLTNYARPTNWRADTVDLINSLYAHDGFQMVVDWTAKDLRPGDILCMAVGERAANHMAVYVGDNKVAHHLWGRLASEDPYRDFFRSTTCFVLRHPDVPDLRPVLPVTDIRSLLRERYDAIRPAD
ncbi:NlpC/P60 family protein [Sphingomonas jaspsi]|uniref:NlpC/P60 family protein n=1 Tax=Sphingomonas jaspsi TaxID=392409 RepID=UPI0004AF7AEB|nr:NlpC/P60 family protein [Sphingomonas jaspsi]